MFGNSTNGTTFTERARISSDGRLGIGTTSPSDELTIRSSQFATTTLSIGDNSDRFRIGYLHASGLSGGTAAAQLGSDAYSDLSIAAPSNGASEIKFFTNASSGTPQQRATIDSSGRLGIGTSSPSVLIEGQTSTANSAYLRLGSTLSTSSHVVDSDIGALEFYSGDPSGAGSGVKGSIRYKYGSTSGATTHMTFHTAGLSSGNDTERMRLDASGNLLVSKTSSSITNTGTTFEAGGRFFTTANGQEAAILNRQTSDGDILQFRKDNTTTVGSIGTEINSIYLANGDVSLMPYGNGDTILPRNGTGGSRDAAIDFGDANNRFKDLYATNGTIQTSDRNEKQDIEALTDAETRVAVAAKGLLRKFRWKDAVAEKGDEARTHFGIIAQDLQDAFTAEGLDAGDYAMFISSTWIDEDGVEQTRLGVRYSELLAFIIAAI